MKDLRLLNTDITLNQACHASLGGWGGGGGVGEGGGGIDHVLNIGVEVEGGGVFKKIFLCSPYASHGHD